MFFKIKSQALYLNAEAIQKKKIKKVITQNWTFNLDGILS